MKNQIYIDDSVKNFRIGDVVYTNNYYGEGKQYGKMVGSITGLSLNCVNEVCFIVKWADGSESLIHPDNIFTL